MKFLLDFLRGAVIGVANVIPGVSGGTMAVVLNIYDKLIGSVSRFFKDWKRNLLFLIPILLGAGAGIFLFGSLIKYLLQSFPMAVNFFFIGLIVGSIPMIYKRAAKGGFKPILLIPFLLACAFMVFLSFLSPEDSSVLITTMSVGTFFRLTITSAVAAVAMLLPGISGSMMLVIFGVYYSIITAISDLNIIILIPVAIGVALGLLGGARLIDICMQKFPQGTFCLVLGLIIGSLVSVYQQAGFAFTWEGLAAVVLLLIGFAVSMLFSNEKLKQRIEARHKSPAMGNGAPPSDKSDSQ